LALALFLSSCGQSDVALQRAATEKLGAGRITGVTVDVEDGVVVLTGEVADEQVKSEAEASVRSVAGIKSVSNIIQIKPLPPKLPSAAGSLLKSKLDEALRKAGCTGAAVELGDDGKVTIAGIVPEAKYSECLMVVNLSGGTDIDNQLKKSK
jgi:hyperosmotically inducible protein